MLHSKNSILTVLSNITRNCADIMKVIVYCMFCFYRVLFYRNTNLILQCCMLVFGFTRNGIGCWFEVEAIFAKKTIVNDRLDSKYFSAIPQEIL